MRQMYCSQASMSIQCHVNGPEEVRGACRDWIGRPNGVSTFNAWSAFRPNILLEQWRRSSGSTVFKMLLKACFKSCAVCAKQYRSRLRGGLPGL